jgi:hypothetical protein
MKLSTIAITLILYLASTSLAYDYTIDSGYTPGLTLQNSKTLLMTGGGIGSLTLDNYGTSATIQGTSALAQGIGGAWEILVAGHLDVSGGEIHEITLDDDGTAILSGGLIEQIYSQQWVAPDPHIEIICRGWNWNTPTNILTGTWEDYTTFNIRLFNQTPYTPVIDNIKFTIVPEPLSLLLLAAGGTLLSRRRR